MKEEAATAALLRQFLLGKVEDEERQRIESLFLTDSHVRERVLAAEQELIDDYLDDCLSTADQQSFLSLYGDTAAQQRKLRIAKSIQEWAVSQPQTQQVRPEPAISAWRRFVERLRLKPILIPIAVTAAVAIVIALVWINSRRTEQPPEYLAMQQELVQLNTPSSLREVPPQMPVLTLKPGSLRGAEQQPELKTRPDASVGELRLLWMQKEDYPEYQVVLRVPGAPQSYVIPHLKAEKEDSKFIRLRLPAQLAGWTYLIELSGVSADGAIGPAEVYEFSISN